jgi:hypothetical protein
LSATHPNPTDYSCTLQPSTVTLAALQPTATASLERPLGRAQRIELAAIFPLAFLCLTGFARRRHIGMRSLLGLALLAVLANVTTSCSSHSAPPTPPGTYPITFTATGTSQGTTTPITHTVTINATIAP